MSEIKNKGDIVNQIMILSDDINRLSSHIQINKKDYATKRTLYRMVSKKKRFLNYLKENDVKKYNALVTKNKKK